MLKPVAEYESECIPATKEIQRPLSDMETKVLIAGIALKGCIMEGDVRRRSGMSRIQFKRAKWYGHVLCAIQDSAAKSAPQLDGSKWKKMNKQKETKRSIQGQGREGRAVKEEWRMKRRER